MAIGPDFESVLECAQGGDQWAFAKLFREFNPRLLRYFAARVPGEADDLAAETWMGAAKQLASFRGDEHSFRAWLFTIAHRRLVQHWRDTKHDTSDPADPSSLGSLSSHDDPAREVVDSATAREAARRIAASLSRDQAEVVLLRVLGGLAVEQVAVLLGKRPGAIRVLQHRAVQKLAKDHILLEGVTR